MARVVVKLGGRVAEGSTERVTALADAGNEVCVVHGAGPQISLEMERRGLEVLFVRGRRYTTPETLEVVRESLAGINRALVAGLGPRAVGLMGDEIGLESKGYGAAEPVAADGGGAAARGWARYAQAVAAELADAGRPAVGMTGTVSSDLPAGSGLSSSAALEVAVGLAIVIAISPTDGKYAFVRYGGL